MPTPSNVTNEFIAPMQRRLPPHEEFDDDIDYDYDYDYSDIEDDDDSDIDEDVVNMAHIIVDGEILEIYEPPDDDSPQFNTDDYC